MKKYRCIVTGGHHNSALVVAKELRDLGHQVDWIGHRYAATGDTHDSAEYREVTHEEIPFHSLKAGKMTPNLRNLGNIPLGFVRATRLIQSVRPDAVISFGGYLGLTVAIAARLYRIPVFLHEQTTIAGKANKVTARFAEKVYLTWADAQRFFPQSKTRVIGLPLRHGFMNMRRKRVFARKAPMIFVLCGKQGSHTINSLIFQHLPEILRSYNLIHQTGTSSVTGDYAKAIALRETLPENLKSAYLPYGYIGEKDIVDYMKSADLVVGRSGAHSTYELGLLGKKAVLIPFMATHGSEQLHNARMLERAGLATIIPQSHLTYTVLSQAVTAQLKRPEGVPLTLPTDASAVMIADILEHLDSQRVPKLAKT